MKGLIGFCLKIGMFLTHGDPDCFDFDKKPLAHPHFRAPILLCSLWWPQRNILC